MPDISRITHPTDFTRESEIAFNHAVRLAVAAGAKLDILHVDKSPQAVAWDEFPSVEDRLKLWGVDGSEGGEEGIRVQQVTEYGREPVHPILKHLEEFPADLIVLATHRREGFDRWLHREIAQKIARSSAVTTLFVPYGIDGFVSASTGAVNLRRVLIPIDWKPEPQAAVDAAAAIVSALGCEEVEFTVLHVGSDELDVPAVELPERAGWTWDQRLEPGAVLEVISGLAEDLDVDLIVMTTEGREGFLDALRGSTTERVLNQVECPVLAVPSAVF